MKDFVSTHRLDFEVAPYPMKIDDGFNWIAFRVGTCEGLWCSNNDFYEILAVVNNKPNNGHFKDVLEWFKTSCKRDKKNLKIREVWNQEFKRHLIEKHFFTKINRDDLIWYHSQTK
jgi:hypothetical protein